MCSQPQLNELDGMDIKQNEVKDEFITNSTDISGKKYLAVQRNGNEECKQLNSMQTENNETVSFIPASKGKRKYSSLSDETSNNAQSGIPPDTLLLSSFLNTSATEVHFEECASFKGCSENFKIDYRSESGFPGVYKRKSSTTGVISEQNEGGSNVSPLIYAASDEESEISIEESKWHSFNKDKSIFLESLEIAVKNARLVSKNISEYSNSLLKSDLSPGNKESDEVSGEITDRPISPDIASNVSSRNVEMAVNVNDTPDTSENAIAVAGPSGIRPYSLKQPEKKGFVCGLCRREFKRSCDFDIHYRTHTDEKPFVCEVCKRGFTRKGDLARHYRTHTGEKPFVCDICQKGFVRRAYLDSHYRTHTGEKPFVCGICEGIFTRKGDLNKHHRTHTGEKSFVCKVCKKGFTQKIDLERHYRMHTGEKPFVCVICQKGFARKFYLVTHYRTHTAETPFVCDICQKGFAQRVNLNIHYRTHTGEKSFVCVLCKKGFTLRRDLDRHYRTHTGENPFECEVCKKGFADRSKLTRHVQTHTGEKPFECSICGKAFTDRSNFNRHYKKKHK
ncbi:Histone-lysine N-methyltransferase PRDM9 [Araneus ventricosus]|uniref:Histone-lysine N-methyltransferase PRDM9 n=1 Tax=Araneus ventricosus TaxID=182803 RepID=A0A4Y2SP44_ARAVE|nr:Histone-lysine N-methyltransferase PRDM9 [Araneus ventricosus]